jgi:hypothetical protein
MYNSIIRHKVPANVKASLDAKSIQSKFDESASIPTNFDWRSDERASSSTTGENVIAEPLNQKSCGSCWAFSICSSLTDRVRIKTRGRYLAHSQLSPFLLAACDSCKYLSTECNLGCGGGVVQWGFDYVAKNGLISMDCNTTTGQYICHSLQDMNTYFKQEPCCIVYKFGQATKVNLFDSHQLTLDKLELNSNAIATEIFANGPVVSVFLVPSSFSGFAFNQKKIYSRADITAAEQSQKAKWGAHAIVFVGYGIDESGKKYWICRNSWGVEWGDAGFFRLERGVNFLECESDVFCSSVFDMAPIPDHCTEAAVSNTGAQLKESSFNPSSGINKMLLFAAIASIASYVLFRNIFISVAIFGAGVAISRVTEGYRAESSQITNDKLRITYHYMDGCHYCKIFDEVWQEFSQTAGPNVILSKTLGGDVGVFPTIVLQKGKHVKTLNGAKTLDVLKNEVASMM